MMKLIAEVKKATPFDGQLVEDVKLEWRIKEYERLGASAISIVTASTFEGEKKWITEAKQYTKLPILRKDFIVTLDDLIETKDLGADWVLIIAELLRPEELEELTFHAWRLGLRPIVEVQSLYGATAVMQHCDTNDVLINNRNLRTGKLNMMNSFRFTTMLPDKYSFIAASGIDGQPQVLDALHKLNCIDYILVGRSLMTSTNLEETFKTYVREISV